MQNITNYLKNPCRFSSIPLWKQKAITIPDNIKIVHNDDYQAADFVGYIDRPYFRLFHNLKNLKQTDVASVEFVDNACEMLDDFVTLINNCYSDLSVDKEQLQSYKKTPVYFKDLWVLLRDKRSKQVIGGGIGDFDAETGEMVLEWVQVLSEFRRRGYGQFIVNAMLSKMKDTAKFATVSGKINSACKPEILYRKCGFTGGDVWHILTKK